MKITNLFLLIILLAFSNCTNQNKEKKHEGETKANNSSLKEISNTPNFKIIKTLGSFDCEVQTLTTKEIHNVTKVSHLKEKIKLEENEDIGNEVTMLVVYTTAAKNNLTHADSIVSAIRRAEDNTNLVFGNNGIDLKVRVVGIIEEEKFVEVSMKNDLGSLYSASKGGRIRNWRDSLYADVVCLVRSTGGGRAVMLTSDNEQTHSEYAYMTIGSECIDKSYFCFCHELGHLLGCGHEKEKASQGIYNYSYGWHFNLPDDSPDEGEIGTMMSYSGAEHRLMSFSDPNFGYQGVAIGSKNANNVATIVKTKKQVANYRVRLQ